MNAEPTTAGNSACPRCGGAFHCGARDSAPCACGTVKLDQATLQGLQERFNGCLCPDCLRRAQAEGASG